MGGAAGCGLTFVKPNSKAMSSGRAPEKRSEKKLRKAAETRDK
jgi:hypothetical protein